MLTSPAVNTYSCLRFPTVLIWWLLNQLWRESVMSAIKNGAPAPQFKSLNCALWYNTHVHCATRRVRLLVPVLSKPCVDIMFGMQLVWWKCHLEEGYINTWQNIIFFVFTHFITFCWGAFSLYALILLWQKTAVTLHAAHKKTDLRAAHEALLVCFLLFCASHE